VAPIPMGAGDGERSPSIYSLKNDRVEAIVSP